MIDDNYDKIKNKSTSFKLNYNTNLILNTDKFLLKINFRYNVEDSFEIESSIQEIDRLESEIKKKQSA